MTVDARPAVWPADVDKLDIATLMTPRLLHQGVFTTVYERRRGFMTLAIWQLSTIRIRVPNRGSIRLNTNSPFGPLFSPVRIRIEYSVQAYI